MRFLVLSDPHGNATALQAALEAAYGRWERAVCLGDLVGYGPDPNEVVGRIREISSTVIRGNHDKAAAGQATLDNFNAVARYALEWTRQELLPENLRYLQELAIGPQVNGELAMVHGSVQDEEEYVFTPAQALEGLLASPRAVTFFGHTHHQGGFSYREEHLQLIHLRPHPGSNFAALRMEPGTRYLLNPGSVGQPRDGDPRAAFAIADLDHGVVEFWRVPYDIRAVQERMKAVGAPEPLVMRLEAGR
jgi:predicted phosphodiesterase